MRETEAHANFLLMFAKTVIMADTFKVNHLDNLLSSYMRSTLEAFAVLTYANSYHQWMEAGQIADMTKEQAAAYGEPRIRRRWTNKTRGTGKYSGWSEEGMTVYYDMEARINIQVKDPALESFEWKLQSKFRENAGMVTGSGAAGEDQPEEEYSSNCFGEEDGVGAEQMFQGVEMVAVAPSIATLSPEDADMMAQAAYLPDIGGDPMIEGV